MRKKPHIYRKREASIFDGKFFYGDWNQGCDSFI